jgi:uncharacterized protein YgbK (DUF1537 family)
LDTREKIRSWDSLKADLSSGKWTVVVGSFDPMTAEQAERLHALAREDRNLLVIVQRDDSDLLDLNARAALVAALRDVTAVMVETADESWRAVAERNGAVQVVEDRGEERGRRMRFERFVLERQAAGDSRAS